MRKSSNLIISLRRYKRQNNGLHGGHIPKSDFRNVEGAHHVRPTIVVCTFECTILAGAQLTAHAGSALLGLAFATEPRTRWHSNYAVTC